MSTPSAIRPSPQQLTRPFSLASRRDHAAGLIGDSPAMHHLRTQLQRIGPYFRRVLLTGEPGTGKELAARQLHQHTPNASGPFVLCDAAAISGALIEPSSITPIRGNDTDCLLSAAQGGTLYLAGICAMPLRTQEQLLHVLLRYERRRREAPQLETRIIASSHRDLRVLAAAGRFRPDLYHRLAMVEIVLPPLRNRSEDLAPLAAHLLAKAATQYSRPAPVLSDAALEQLCQHTWPGNIRELENVLRSAMLAGDGGFIEPYHLPALTATPTESQRKAPARSARLQDVIDQHVVRVLEQCDGNKARAAELLGISRSTLYRMLETGLAAIS